MASHPRGLLLTISHRYKKLCHKIWYITKRNPMTFINGKGTSPIGGAGDFNVVAGSRFLLVRNVQPYIIAQVGQASGICCSRSEI